MSSVKKMMLVDPSQWQSRVETTNNLPAPLQPLPDPLASSITSLDQTIQAILQTPSDGDDYTKAQVYSQALQRYLRQADQYREKPLGKVTFTEPAQEDKPRKDISQIKDLLRQILPTNYIRGGTSLADTVTTLPEVSWDDKLQLKIGEKTVQDSNIVDLLSDLARKKKTSKPPKGMDELLGVLKERNVAHSLIPNEARRSALTSDRVTRLGRAPLKKTPALTGWTERKY